MVEDPSRDAGSHAGRASEAICDLLLYGIQARA
jgi:hypothetical protein